MRTVKIALILFFLTICFNLPSQSQSAHLVRVVVITDAVQINLTVRCPYRILALNNNQVLYQSRGQWRGQKVLAAESGIKIGEQEFKGDRIRIQPSRSPAIYVNGRKFRGAIDIMRQPNQKLLVINYVDIEEYVQGVLYHEVAPRWPMEALKAQAIAARTFALYQAQLNARKEYDLVSTVYSQVYGGSTSERASTSKAVQLTKGQVLTYKNKLFPAFYHATCAGYTENAANLWKINIPPLRGRECQFCLDSPHYRWKAKLSFKDIEKALNKAGYTLGRIQSIKIIERYVSGAVSDLEIISSSGTLKLSGNRLRLIIGPNMIKSAKFKLQLNGKYAYFQGYGWGHGVGMCQWGAFFMSKKDFTAEQILGYYYPESKIKNIEEIRNAQGKFETF